MDRAPSRFVALDSLRGLCACAVALFHFHGPGLLGGSALVRGSWLFVDFFFVLSGFVIAHAYRARLAEGFSSARFIGLRLGRIYPLHIFMLLVYLVAVLLAGEAAAANRTPRQFFESLSLLHSFGSTLHNWNAPSWSIAAEFWAYLAFAVLVTLLRRRAAAGFAALAATGLVVLLLWSPEGLNSSFQLGLFRCFYGFGLGALVQTAAAGWRWSGTLAESLSAGLALILVAAGGPLAYAAPPVFCLVVLVFAREEGALSRVLRTRAMTRLGLLSYSIYMVHSFVQGRIHDLFELLEPHFGLDLTRKDPLFGDVLAVGPVASDVLSLAMLAVVITAAGFTWRFVEQPAQAWSRRLLGGRTGAPVPA